MKGFTKLAIPDQRIREEIEALIEEGTKIRSTETGAKSKSATGSGTKKSGKPPVASKWLQLISYQQWYTKALPIVRQLIPDRYAEFQQFYQHDRRATGEKFDIDTYAIRDYLLGFTLKRGGSEVVDPLTMFTVKFLTQLAILKSALTRLDSILADIRGILQAEFFDDEISAANELLAKGHLRAAGAVAGVVLERHLAQVAAKHNVTMKKKDPTIADFNDALKAQGYFDIPNWRFVQRLGDIRNLCAHSKQREPTKDEVDELIRGTEKSVKTLT